MALKEYKPGICIGVTSGRAPGSPITSLRAAVRIRRDDPLGDGGYFGPIASRHRGGGESVRAGRDDTTVSDDNSFASNIFVNQVRRNLVREGVS
jgi:hypothetical protein